MTVYVDGIQHYSYCKLRYKDWCHMYADTDEELHAMAAKIGLKREWFQHHNPISKHYDLVPTKRASAIAHGAVEDNDHKHMLRLMDTRYAELKIEKQKSQIEF